MLEPSIAADGDDPEKCYWHSSGPIFTATKRSGGFTYSHYAVRGSCNFVMECDTLPFVQTPDRDKIRYRV
ncbi:MAG: hypothetical protein JWQ87_2980 [Candidatus Sulfotelmatobacter sp.]|nr:hypothetical protein [Candidatus Sulfotelmatobacter sp.]